jgi:hypothetical protein
MTVRVGLFMIGLLDNATNNNESGGLLEVYDSQGYPETNKEAQALYANGFTMYRYYNKFILLNNYSAAKSALISSMKCFYAVYARRDISGDNLASNSREMLKMLLEKLRAMEG